MKKSVYGILLILVLIACNNKSEKIKEEEKELKTYANEYEKKVIETMCSWSSDQYMWRIMKTNNSEEEEKENDKLQQEERDKANFEGRKSLLNDTIFINSIRNDKFYNKLLNERKDIAKLLKKQVSLLTYFSEYLTEAINNIVKYEYYDGLEFGLYKESINRSEFSYDNRQFYKNLSSILKEAYVADSNLNVSADEVKKLNDLLVQLENIDRHIWCVDDYLEARDKINQENMEAKKRSEIDSIIN